MSCKNFLKLVLLGLDLQKLSNFFSLVMNIYIYIFFFLGSTLMFITYASCTMGTMFMLLPADEQVDESLVPILVFKDRPIAYHAFLVSINV